jgi:hypothetical protein
LVEFPTVKCQDGVSYECAPHVVIPISQNIENKNITKYRNESLISRTLDNSHYDFLEKFEGHTEDTIGESSGTFNQKMCLIKSDSPLTHFFKENTKVTSCKSVGDDCFQLKKKEYDKVVTRAKKSVTDMFGFSDITSSAFNIKIEPAMDGYCKKKIENELASLQKKYENACTLEKEGKKPKESARELQTMINALNAQGFNNFYMMTQNHKKDVFDEFKKGMTFKFQGKVTCTYIPVYKQKKD